MRFIGMLLALGAITWVMYQASGGGKSETVISESQQQAVEKAQDLEKTIQLQTQKRLEGMDEQLEE
jgi:hypothetical protein